MRQLWSDLPLGLWQHFCVGKGNVIDIYQAASKAAANPRHQWKTALPPMPKAVSRKVTHIGF